MNTYLLIMLTEIRKDKIKLIKDPIKRMSYKGSGSAREVVRMIALALGLKIHEDEYGISAYGGNAIRIADHCTYMQTWVDRGTWNAPIRLDVVIEEEPTQAVTQVKNGYDFTIVEFVYDITDVDTQNARTIAYDIRNVINGNQYANNARGKRRTLKSTHNSNENKQYNKNTNMKQTIRLTESELKNMITESVKRVLMNEVKAENEPMTVDNRYDLLHGGYPRHTFQQYREEASETFDKWIYELNDVYTYFLITWPHGVLDPITAAKQFGYTKSYKRLLEAKKHVEKALDLLKATKQDMCAEYVNKDYKKRERNYGGSNGYEGSGFSSNGIGYY